MTPHPMEIDINTPAGAMLAVLRDTGVDSLGAIRDCPGYQLSIPAESINQHYPFAAHMSSTTYPWSVPNEVGAVFAQQGFLAARS